MRKLLLALALSLASAPAWAQCNGVFPNNTICGNVSGAAALPRPITSSSIVTGPATSVVGHLAFWNNTAGSVLADLPAGAAGTLLQQSSGAATQWTTATFPSTTTINQILYSSANNVITGLATANNAVLATNASGVPALTVTPTLGVAGASRGTLTMAGNTSGSQVWQPASTTSGTITWPSGTVDFSSTGGTSQVVKQTSAGGIFTVAQLAASDLSNGTTGSGAVVLTGSPTISNASLSLNNTATAFELGLVSTDATMSANRNLIIDTQNSSPTLTLSASFTYAGGHGLTLTTTAPTGVTLPTSGTLAILGANAFTASQTLTLSQDALTSYTISNVNTGTSADAAHVATNANGNAYFGIAGANYSVVTLLQNRAFIVADAALAGIVLHNIGDDPIIFSLNGAERGRFQAVSGATAVMTLGVAGTQAGSVALAGATSGGVVLAPANAVAGTPSILFGNTSGTVAASATSPLAISATTGVITCTTCGVTGTGLNQFASTTSAQLAGVISDETGTGVLVFGTAPTFTTSITSPLIIGGSGTTGTQLTLKTTTGNGTTDQLAIVGGNNGATTFATFTSNGLGLNGGQIAFPATQNPSSDANTLDDYEEGSWTPAISAATVGDLSVAYSQQVGTYVKVGRLVTVTIQLVTSSFTYTTASGAVQITGLPFTSETLTNVTYRGTTIFSGLTKATYTQFVCTVTSNVSIVTMQASGSAVAAAVVNITDFPTGGSVIISTTITYRAAS